TRWQDGLRALARRHLHRTAAEGRSARSAVALEGHAQRGELVKPPQPVSSGDPRLSKRMSELGLCSRREAEAWIVNGWVRVDGAVCSTLGVRVSPQAQITVDAAARQQQRELVTVLLHKPVGYVSG